MRKRSSRTPRSQVRSALRRLWLRSRERSQALQRTGYCCEECGRKQSKATGKEFVVEVHHADGAQIDRVIDYVFRHLLCEPDSLRPLCPECHDKLHGGEK